MSSLYFNQANLLLDLVSFLNQESDFALKGGSAINYFVRDLQRLSVDIDLMYLPIKKTVWKLCLKFLQFRWKLYNLSKMKKSKHKIALDKLSRYLEVEL